MKVLWKVYHIRFGEYKEKGRQFPIHPALHNKDRMYMYCQIQEEGQPLIWGLKKFDEMKRHYKNSHHEIKDYEVFPKVAISKVHYGKKVADLIAHWRQVRQEEIERNARKKQTNDAEALHDTSSSAAAAALLSAVAKVSTLHHSSSQFSQVGLAFADDEEDGEVSVDEGKTTMPVGEHADDGRRFQDADDDDDEDL